MNNGTLIKWAVIAAVLYFVVMPWMKGRAAELTTNNSPGV
jgi:hypothetical protein